MCRFAGLLCLGASRRAGAPAAHVHGAAEGCGARAHVSHAPFVEGCMCARTHAREFGGVRPLSVAVLLYESRSLHMGRDQKSVTPGLPEPNIDQRAPATRDTAAGGCRLRVRVSLRLSFFKITVFQCPDSGVLPIYILNPIHIHTAPRRGAMVLGIRVGMHLG